MHIEELLQKSTDLPAYRADAAAAFIGACLRLNPADRPSAKELRMHDWLGTAFMGGADQKDTALGD